MSEIHSRLQPTEYSKQVHHQVPDEKSPARRKHYSCLSSIFISVVPVLYYHFRANEVWRISLSSAQTKSFVH